MTPLLLLAASLAAAQSTGLFGGRSAVSTCPERMVAVGNFCIDKYEAPNVPGHKPLLFKTADEGAKFCFERGKRLCTEAEWVRACQGASGRAYPYGERHQDHACNDDKVWRRVSWAKLGRYPAKEAVEHAAALDQADPSGSREACVSEEGVYDLTGNAAEWVVRSYAHKNNYPHVLKGCFWSKCYGGGAPSCSSTNSAHPGQFRTYEAGFRCCRDR